MLFRATLIKQRLYLITNPVHVLQNDHNIILLLEWGKIIVLFLSMYANRHTFSSSYNGKEGKNNREIFTSASAILKGSLLWRCRRLWNCIYFLQFSNTIVDKSAVTLGNFSQNLFRKFVAILVVHYEMGCTWAAFIATCFAFDERSFDCLIP